MSMRGKHLRISPETKERLKDLIGDAGIMLGSMPFDFSDGEAARKDTSANRDECVDGRAKQDKGHVSGADFDATSDKFFTSDRRFDIIDFIRRQEERHAERGFHHAYSAGAEHVFHMPTDRMGETAIAGSLAWKYPDAVDVESWEVPMESSPELDS